MHICGFVVGDNPSNDCCHPVPPTFNVDAAFIASNSLDVNIEDDEEPYGTARAVDSDDDRPVAPLSEQEMELIRRFCPDRDPLVHEFSDLSHSQNAYAEGRDDELLEAPEPGESVQIQKGMIFNDLPSLRRWLQQYSVIRKRPFKVMHSHVERRYTVVCEMSDCNWRVCARKQKATGKFKITKIVGPHTCAQTDLQQKHRQLTSTLIASTLCTTLKGQPNLKVRTIMDMAQKIFKYDIKYGKAWRAKQRAWKMIYGDWEEGYEQLPAMFNAMKAANPGMHYEYIPKPNEWRNGRQIFFRAFWCFPQCVQAFRHCRPVLSIDGTFLLGKYMGTLLVAISCDADNALVPLAFALVERENKDSWGWFMRLVRIHVIGPHREVGVISDRHQGILSAVQEQIPGYAPLHHRWCTRHLAENLLRKDGTKDNFPLFEEVARMLEVPFFEEKLEQLKTATNAEGRQWLLGLMREPEKWTRAHDNGGWRYEFQTSNMAESFNSVLKGIRAMPVNAIVSFTFYRLVAWFNDRHAQALQLQSNNMKWAPRAKKHLDKAKERARTHDIECFDHATGKYQVTERGGTTSDGEIRPSRSYIVVLTDFSCGCGRPRQYHSPCSHYIAAARHRNFDYETKIPWELSVDSLVLTWSPRFEPFLDEGQWPEYIGPRYIADPGARWNKRGTRKRTRHKMVMDQISGRTRRGRATPFVTDPEQNQCGKCGRLGHNSRTCHWPLSQVHLIFYVL
jgi:transposase-like protein